jgi:hypothetical protein
MQTPDEAINCNVCRTRVLAATCHLYDGVTGAPGLDITGICLLVILPLPLHTKAAGDDNWYSVIDSQNLD